MTTGHFFYSEKGKVFKMFGPDDNDALSLISKYLNTPLIWGIFSGKENPIQYYGEIYSKRYAISRLGSGSHLMPIIDAQNKNNIIAPDQFVLVKNLEGALASLSALEADVFYWEKYTTKPYVDSGQL